MSTFSCEFCNKKLKSKQGLERHNNICTQKEYIKTIRQKFESDIQEKLRQQRKEYEKEFEQQRKYYEEKIKEQEKEQQIQLQSQQEKYESKNQILEQKITEQREQIEKLETQIFEIAKQPKQQVNQTNTTHNNQKTLNILNQLAPYDLTTEKVQEMLDSYALEKVFNEGPTGITEFVVEKILTDPDTQKPKLIATDRSRGVFKYKDMEGNLHIDNKLTKTTDILQRPLFKANKKNTSQRIKYLNKK